MKDNLVRSLNRYQRTFAAFTPGQKVVAILGTAALMLAGFMVFRWVSQPDYAPLFSNLSSTDASAVIAQLDTKGVPYKISNGGATVMVPKNDVYTTRISLSGAGLPANSDGGGYSLLDKQSLSTSQFKEQTDYKRAMEGELAKTIEALDGVQSSVVHLALPAKQVFADKQDPPTASVLVATNVGTTLTPDQVQAVVHLVAASIDGMDPNKVTVADSTGKLLSTAGTVGGAAASTQSQFVNDYQDRVDSRIQNILDRVVGPGNSTVQVTAVLNFDKSVIESKNYKQANPPKGLELSTNDNLEKFKGAGGSGGSTGVVGPDGQMDGSLNPTGSGSGNYLKKSHTADNALDTTVEHRETAPGQVQALHIGVVLDQTAAANTNPNEIDKMIRSAVGINAKRGDTLYTTTLPFNRAGEQTAAKELAAQNAAAAKAARFTMLRNAALGVLLLLALLFAWLKGRKRSKQRDDATSFVVEQLRTDSARREQERALESPASGLLSLEGAPRSQEEEMREELIALVESQPEDVATLLRGWLVER